MTFTDTIDRAGDDLPLDLLGHLVDICDEAIVLFSLDDGIVYWSKAAVSIYGVQASQARGQDPNALTCAQYAEDWSQITQHLYRGKTWVGDVLRQNSGGQSVVTATRLRAIQDDAGNTLILQVDRDETRQHAARQNARLLASDLHHRVKNLFAIIQSIIRLSFRLSKDDPKLDDKICDRLKALAQAEVLSIEPQHVGNMPMEALLRSTLVPFDLHKRRITLTGPDVSIPVLSITPLSLIINELATNAQQYGAMRDDHDQIDITWSVAGDGAETPRMHLTWTEKCANPPETPAETANGHSFGSRLLSISAMQIDGDLQRDMGVNGLTYTLTFPLIDT